MLLPPNLPPMLPLPAILIPLVDEEAVSRCKAEASLPQSAPAAEGDHRRGGQATCAFSAPAVQLIGRRTEHASILPSVSSLPVQREPAREETPLPRTHLLPSLSWAEGEATKQGGK